MTRPRSLMWLSFALLLGLDSLTAAAMPVSALASTAEPVAVSAATPLAGLEARTDRSRIGLGETVQLLLRYRGARPTTPDLSVLEDSFEILDAGQSSRTSIVNGVADRSFDWRITLAPRREGTLAIPSFTVGGASSVPLSVEVVASGAGAAGTGGTGGTGGLRSDAPVRLEVEVDDAEPYVQGKVTVTARITMDESVREGALADPALQGALIERLGEDSSFRTEVDGRPCTVVERRYALFPQASGEVVIPPLVFEGTQRESGGRRRPTARDPFAEFFGSDPFGSDPFGSSPFGSSMMGGLFDRGRRVRAQSEAIRLNVQPRPGSTRGARFLPATHVELFEEWSPEPPVFRVGERVVRSLGIQAIGLSGDQLPDLALPELTGAKQYAEEGANRTFATDGETVALRVREVAVLPTRAGELTLPVLELEWWDTAADARRTASLPARTVTVLPALGGDAVAGTGPGDNALDGSPATASSDVGANEGGSVGWQAWTPLVGVTALCGLALGIGAVLLRRRRRISAPDELDAESAHATAVLVGPADRTLRDACQAGDAPTAARALVQAGRARYPALGIRNLGDVASALPHEDLTRAIDGLSAAAFAPAGSSWNGTPLWQAWSRCKRRPAGADRGPVDALPGLYPTH